MASTNFQAYDFNLRRRFLADIVDAEVRASRRRNFRASIVTNPITGQPVRCEPHPAQSVSIRHSN